METPVEYRHLWNKNTCRIKTPVDENWARAPSQMKTGAATLDNPCRTKLFET